MVFRVTPHTHLPWCLRLAVCAMLAPARVIAGAAHWQPTHDSPPSTLTLDAALDRVIATDQTVAIADYEVRKAAVEQLRAWTRVLPSLSAGADATHRVRVELTVAMTGPLAGLAHVLYGRTTQRYLVIEAEGLRAACEG